MTLLQLSLAAPSTLQARRCNHARRCTVCTLVFKIRHPASKETVDAPRLILNLCCSNFAGVSVFHFFSRKEQQYPLYEIFSGDSYRCFLNMLTAHLKMSTHAYTHTHTLQEELKIYKR